MFISAVAWFLLATAKLTDAKDTCLHHGSARGAGVVNDFVAQRRQEMGGVHPLWTFLHGSPLAKQNGAFLLHSFVPLGLIFADTMDMVHRHLRDLPARSSLEQALLEHVADDLDHWQYLAGDLDRANLTASFTYPAGAHPVDYLHAAVFGRDASYMRRFGYGVAAVVLPQLNHPKRLATVLEVINDSFLDFLTNLDAEAWLGSHSNYLATSGPHMATEVNHPAMPRELDAETEVAIDMYLQMEWDLFQGILDQWRAQPGLAQISR